MRDPSPPRPPLPCEYAGERGSPYGCDYFTHKVFRLITYNWLTGYLAGGTTVDHEKFKRGLLDDTLRFWFPRCVDREHGGFLHFFDADGSLIDTDKSIWAQGRMSWLLLTLFRNFEQRSEWLEWAESGLNFLERFGFDADGRMFFHVTRDGRPIRKRRYAYSEAFAAIAWAAHYRATGKSASADRARQLFQHFTDWNFTPGKMPPKYTDVRPMIGLAPRMITLVTAQELRECLGEDDKLTQWIDRSIEEMERLFVKHDLQVVMESVAPDGSIVDHCDGRALNPGHAIEGAWFILREGSVSPRQSTDQARLPDAGLHVAPRLGQ